MVLFVPKHEIISVLVFDEGAGLVIPVHNTVLLTVIVPVMLAFPLVLSVVQVKAPEESEELTPSVPVIIEFPVTLMPLVEVRPLHERDFELLNDIFVLNPSLIANRGADTETL